MEKSNSEKIINDYFNFFQKMEEKYDDVEIIHAGLYLLIKQLKESCGKKITKKLIKSIVENAK